MIRKNYFLFLLFIALVSLGSSAVFAQTDISGSSTTDKQKAIGGIVEKKVDGKKVPVEGIRIDCYRMDVKESCGSVTSDAKGEFSLTVPEKSTVVLAISGPGTAASVVTAVRLDNSNAIDVSAGDGSVPNEDNVRFVALTAFKESGNLTAEQKKELEALENLTAKVQANNEKIKERNELRVKYNKEGNDAFNSGNFDLAIAKFEEGYQIDPEFLGSAPTFLNNKSIALRQRGALKYNDAAKSKDAGRIRVEKENLTKDLTSALEAASKAYFLLKDAKNLDGIDAQKQKDLMAESEKAAKDAIKILSQLNLNLAANTEEETSKGIKISKDLLKMFPKDADVMAILGLSLFAAGEMQESLNYFTLYMESAPKDHSRREAVNELVNYLINDEKLKPKKVN